MRRAFLFLILAGTVIGALLITVAFMRKSSGVVVLPNAARIEFLGTAIGDAEYTTERTWHRTARNLLPAPLTRWIPTAYGSTCSSGSNSVTFYFRVTDPSGFAGGADPWSSYTIDDESGFRYLASGGSCNSGGAARVYGLILRAFPRRQADLQFAFRDGSGEVLGTLTVPNPVTGPFPKWQPQALPRTQTVNSVTLELRSLRKGGSARWPTIVPEWDLSSSDPAWAKARVIRATFADATGNEGQRLSPGESAWRLRALVSRERAEDFSPAEILMLTNLAIPAAGFFVDLDQSAERQGVKLTVLLLAGAGRLHITNGVGRGMSTNAVSERSSSSQGTNRTETWGSASPFLLVQAQNVQPDDEVRLRLIDAQGQEIKLSDNSGSDGFGFAGHIYKRSFTPRGDAESLTLEVIVNRPLPFEFMVNPADVLPARTPETNQ